MKTFEIKTKVVFGEDALGYLTTLKDQKVFIVTDPFMVKSGMIERITSKLTTGNYEIFQDVVPDPPMELVVEGVSKVTAYRPDAVVALGGGSAIDAAKAIMNFSKKAANLMDMEFIAIPTTSGTGSEVTNFAVITDKQKGVKYPLVSSELLPQVAILEPELVRSLPSAIVADTGMDVLTHAVEAYVSTKATDFSDALAEKAVTLVFEYLLRSYQSSDDIEAKEKMHAASCLAGMAFNEASLGLNHAIAHNIGGKLHIPHGRTNAILLPYVMEYNSKMEGYNPRTYTYAAKRYAKLAKLCGIQGATTRTLVKGFISEIQRLEREMKMPSSIKECGVKEEVYLENKKEIAQGALLDACMDTNPREATLSDVLEILHQIR
ncbi:1-propanol dehydrogenase PduQ [Anaerosporobacter faecicola]|uniref:1-propanol dehydrogenase PduQ n=1 Tax=Anaerosporobacter faecicola TaxID=2718714 RepID=UPI001439CA69|nr:1-propanol dehydrogenase PduQ [Anaerosporobacter faecicola]